jgi:hypothetical protein
MGVERTRNDKGLSVGNGKVALKISEKAEGGN